MYKKIIHRKYQNIFSTVKRVTDMILDIREVYLIYEAGEKVLPHLVPCSCCCHNNTNALTCLQCQDIHSWQKSFKYVFICIIIKPII